MLKQGADATNATSVSREEYRTPSANVVDVKMVRHAIGAFPGTKAGSRATTRPSDARVPSKNLSLSSLTQTYA